MSNIFDLYTCQQIREMYFKDKWPEDYADFLYYAVCHTLYANATKEEIKEAEINAIDDWTHGQDDHYGFQMAEFTGKNNVKYTENGPQLLLFDMNDE